MGVPKAGIEIGAVALVERVRRAAAAVVEDVFLVGKDAEESPLAGVPFVTEDHPERCALAGVVAALRHAGDRPVLVLACDLPFLVPDLLRCLLEGGDVGPPCTPRWRTSVRTWSRSRCSGRSTPTWSPS
jgi:molybdopterin-guanine dinucleotide biosynthesis protein A